MRPTRILQAIAAGLMGREAAVAGGLRTAALGLVLHFFIAFMVVLTYYLASRRIRALAQHPVLCGVLYGLVVYAVMNYVVVPLSAAPPRTLVPPTTVLINGLLIHALGVGLPAALSVSAISRAPEHDGRILPT